MEVLTFINLSKLKNMKTKNIFLALIAIAFGLFSCADESKKPILTFDDAIKGGYAKLIEQSDKLINVLNETTINASKYTYSVEFVDTENGKLVTEYRLDLTYVAAGGASKSVTGFKTWSQDQLTDGPNGLRALIGIEITAPDMMAALGLTANDLGPGDQFRVEGFVQLSDGNVYGFANSSAAVNGSAFQGHFNYTLPAACPSDLTGSYAYEGYEYDFSAIPWSCSTDSGAGSVDIVAMGGGTYYFTDWSFGAYAACWGGGVVDFDGLNFTDVCTEVSYTGFTDSFGDKWDFAGSSIAGNVWDIHWINTYGEAGKGRVLYTGGADWPITLK